MTVSPATYLLCRLHALVAAPMLPRDYGVMLFNLRQSFFAQQRENHQFVFPTEVDTQDDRFVRKPFMLD